MRDDLLFYRKQRLQLLVRAGIGDSVADPFDFLLASRMYNDVGERLSSISYVFQPQRMRKYGRDLTVSLFSG